MLLFVDEFGGVVVLFVMFWEEFFVLDFNSLL